MNDLTTLAMRLNRAIDQLLDVKIGDNSNAGDYERYETLLAERQKDLASLNDLRQEVRDLIEEIKND